MGDLPTTCIQLPVRDPNTFWQVGDVLKSELSLFGVQLTCDVITGLMFYYLLKPLRQPHIITIIAAGFMVATMFKVSKIMKFLYPPQGIMNIEVLSNFGLILYSFLGGLEMNLNTILNAQKKASVIAVAGIIIPLVTGPALYSLHIQTYIETPVFMLEKNKTKACILWTSVLAVTGFPILAHTLSELKLLYTGLGKTALTTAMISDTYAWLIFIILTPFSISEGESAVLSVISTLAFIFLCVFVLHPIINYYIDQSKDEWADQQMVLVVMGVVAFSWITDFLGTHGVVGAFVFGMILPHGKFADYVTSITDDIGTSILAPAYFIGTGLRVKWLAVYQQPNWKLTVLVIVLLCVPKILSTLFATFFFGMRGRDGFALGLLLNTKGVVAFVLVNNGWDRKILSRATYAVLTFGIILMTVIVPPTINAIYRPRKRFEQNKLKSIQKLRSDAELRIVACVHNTRNATSLISVIETFSPTRLTPMHVFGVYLVELTGRDGAAVVAAHLEKPNAQGSRGEQNLTRTQAELESITNTFEALGDAYDAIRVDTLNVVSSYATIHEDIYSTAKEKHTSLILLPFHKQLTPEGNLETTSVMYRDINQNIMQGAPCSVGIFVDRDINSYTSKPNYFHIVMVFIGGPDDREALAVARRMACRAGTRLSVVRMVLFDEAAEVDSLKHNEADMILHVVMDNEMQRDLDEEYISSFRLTEVNNNDLITYSEVEVHTAEDIPVVLNEVEKGGCDLYIVGQGNCRNLTVFTTLSKWCECSELGVIGDIMASDNFTTHASLLVVQQYGYGGMVFDKQQFNHMDPLVVKSE